MLYWVESGKVGVGCLSDDRLHASSPAVVGGDGSNEHGSLFLRTHYCVAAHIFKFKYIRIGSVN